MGVNNHSPATYQIGLTKRILVITGNTYLGIQYPLYWKCRCSRAFYYLHVDTSILMSLFKTANNK